MKKEDYLKNQEIKYKLGVIDRRQFISSAIATGLAVPAALGLAGQLQFSLCTIFICAGSLRKIL